MTDVASQPEPEPPEQIVLEDKARLSKSILWGLQTAAYCQFGPDAWGSKAVPFYITSNPYIARQYAYVVLGYLRDCLAPNSATPIDLSHPVYIFDLGAGTGRFAYLFLKTLLMICGVLRKDELKICYVMTDIARSNIDYWMRHPFLENFVEKGVLDFACYYHAEKDPNLHLRASNRSLNPETVHNPVVVIGNYFFDTIPQDLFTVKDGKLLEGQVTLSMDKSDMTEALLPTDPEVIRHLNYTFDYAPIEQIEGYYPDFPELHQILKVYASRFENIPFQFPVGAFETIRFFKELSHGRLLLLAGDQGRCTESQMQQFEPYIAKHSSFSLSVNYHAIAMYFRHCGGMSLLTTYPEPLFVVVAATLGAEKDKYPETTLAFRTHIDYFEPNDYLKIVNCTETQWLEPTLESIFLILKLGNWDPVTFNHFFERIRELVPKAATEERESFVQVIYNIWDRFYPINIQDGAFVMNLGVVLYDLERYPEAIAFFQRALDLGYENEMIYGNLAASYSALKDFSKAIEWKEKAESVKKLE
ncbi:MAG: tetratricopeptide repeat protein [Parachlamydia sp.]|nr:tetratricopeptide repeat protein [Parachlamydia sp.]